MIEDMHIRGMGDNAQKSHILVIKGFASFFERLAELVCKTNALA